jgi:hypothetical protein
MKVLNILSTGYRATLEEQDDTVVWICHALKNAGAEVDLLLRGSAVNYLVAGQHAPPLAIGDRRQRHSPDPHGQLLGLSAKGVAVFALAEDLMRYGLGEASAPPAIRLIATSSLPVLASEYDQIWHW